MYKDLGNKLKSGGLEAVCMGAPHVSPERALIIQIQKELRGHPQSRQEFAGQRKGAQSEGGRQPKAAQHGSKCVQAIVGPFTLHVSGRIPHWRLGKGSRGVHAGSARVDSQIPRTKHK